MARDYILRLIEQVAALLAGIVAKQRAGQLAEARRDLEALCVQTIGLDLTQLKGSSPESVAQRLAATGGLRAVRAITLAELLLKDSEWTGAEVDPRPAGSAEVHAFCLLADSLDSLGAEDREHYRALLERLAANLGPFRGHPYLQDRLRALGLENQE